MKKKSFTLLEVLTSIVLIAIAMIPLMQIVTQGLVLSQKEEKVTKVIFLAQNKIEEIVNKVEYNFDLSRDSQGVFSSPYGNYRYIVTDNEASSIKMVSVSVWCDENASSTIDNDEENISLSTKITDKG